MASIKELRLSMKLTQAEFGKLCGISQQTVQRIEQTGQCNMSTTIKISKATGISIDELLKKAQDH